MQARKVVRLCSGQAPSPSGFAGHRNSETAFQRLSALFNRRVITFARLDLVAFFGFDFEAAKAAVVLLRGGRVANAVLAAQFIGNLGKGCAQLVWIADSDGPAAGLLRQLAHAKHIGTVLRV